MKSVSENADLVVGLFKDKDDKDFVMLMNKDYRDSVTACITLNRSATELKYFNIETGQWLTVDYHNEQDGAVFQVSLRPGGGKLFTVGQAPHVEGFDQATTPKHFILRQNYPNPFNPVTTIEYELQENEHVNPGVFDLLGRQVNVLVDARQKAGMQKATWSSAGFPSGVYVYNLQVGAMMQSRKMVVLK